MTAGIIVVVVVTGLAGVTRAVELFVSDERMKVVETDVTRATISRPDLRRIQVVLQGWTVVALLLDFSCVYGRGRLGWLRFPIYLGSLCWNFLRGCGWWWLGSWRCAFVLQDTFYVIFLLVKQQFNVISIEKLV